MTINKLGTKIYMSYERQNGINCNSLSFVLSYQFNKLIFYSFFLDLLKR